MHIERFKDTLRYDNPVSQKAILNRDIKIQGYSEEYVNSLMQNGFIYSIEIDFGNYIIFHLNKIRGNNFGNVYYIYLYSNPDELIKRFKHYELTFAPDKPANENCWIYLIDSTWGIMLSSPN